MTGTIFDLIEPEIGEGKEGFFDLAKNAPQPKDKSFLGDIKDYAKTFLKGSAEGLSRAGLMISPTIEGKIQGEQQLEEQTEKLNELLPTDEKFGQSGLRRGLKQLPSMISFPGATAGTASKSILAGFSGEGAKELGAPELVQTAAELTAFLSPDITKKLLESGKNKELIEAARKLGLSDEAITPLIQSDFKTKWLSKLAPKRGSTQKALGQTKSELSQAYSSLQTSEIAKNGISKTHLDNFMEEVGKRLFNMPANVRNKVKEDLKDLLNAPITGETLMNFYADVNHNLGSKTKQLSLLKEPIKKALSSLSPELGKDFEMVNNLYAKYHNIASKLRPNLTDDIIKAGETLGLLGSVALGNLPGIMGFVAEKAGRKIAQQMLFNPRFQQISKKIVESVKDNSFGMTKKLFDLLKHEVKKVSPESVKDLEDISIEELENLFTHQKAEEE